MRAFPNVGELVLHQMCFLAETLGAVVTREGLLPVCTCSCEPRWIFCEKQRSQWVQVKGRFPVCKRACSVMWVFLPKVLPHWEQSKVWGWGSPWLDTSRGSQVLTLGAAQWLLFTQHMHCCKAKPESSLRPSLALYSSLGLRLSDLQTPSTGSPESSNSAHRPPGVVVCFHFHRSATCLDSFSQGPWVLLFLSGPLEAVAFSLWYPQCRGGQILLAGCQAVPLPLPPLDRKRPALLSLGHNLKFCNWGPQRNCGPIVLLHDGVLGAVHTFHRSGTR